VRRHLVGGLLVAVDGLHAGQHQLRRELALHWRGSVRAMFGLEVTALDDALAARAQEYGQRKAAGGTAHQRRPEQLAEGSLQRAGIGAVPHSIIVKASPLVLMLLISAPRSFSMGRCLSVGPVRPPRLAALIFEMPPAARDGLRDTFTFALLRRAHNEERAPFTREKTELVLVLEPGLLCNDDV